MIILNSTRPMSLLSVLWRHIFIPLMQASNNRTVHRWKRSRTWQSLWPVENLAALGPCRWPAQVTEFARISVKQWNPDQQKQVRLEATQYDTRSHKIIQHACCRFYINICMTLYDIVWLYDIIVIESIEGGKIQHRYRIHWRLGLHGVAGLRSTRAGSGCREGPWDPSDFRFLGMFFFSNYPYTYPLRLP